MKKGEKAIKILAPAPFKAKKEVQKLDAQGRPVMGKDGKPVTEVQEIQVPAFKIVSAFDVSQTEGEPLPSIGVEELTGSVERYGEFFKALEQTSPVPIGFEDIPGGSHGYYHLTEKRIAIQEGMSELQTLKTAIHEIAHESWKNHVLHHEGPEAWEADKAQRDMLLHEFVPYMELHCNLAAMEQEARRPLRSGETLTPEQTAYFNAVLDYVKECRPLLNQGQHSWVSLRALRYWG